MQAPDLSIIEVLEQTQGADVFARNG